ncbi:hypothetical protein OU5_P0176 (plasmid) [Pseudomonas mandelii JR-1]|uniref:Uncharacterized protein n=1 Tax=Pseudomonas mandelii JR-1 TaxID=1147786 RepID=A0A024ELZ6_9PSED|nr:hypothetical protein OU5_P0176 [Pseudomonas mandelii JR-1]
MHGIQAQIEHGGNQEQLQPQWTLDRKESNRGRHRIAKPGQNFSGELNDRKVHQQVQQVGRGVLMSSSQALRKGWMRSKPAMSSSPAAATMGVVGQYGTPAYSAQIMKAAQQPNTSG